VRQRHVLFQTAAREIDIVIKRLAAIIAEAETHED
jgi:hypothetical protein